MCAVRSRTKTARASCRHSLPPHAILLTERLTAMSREGLVQHARALLPACLHLRRVHPHRIDARICWPHDRKRLPLLDHLVATRLPKGVYQCSADLQVLLSQRGEIVRTALTNENFCSQCNWRKARTHP